MKVDFGPMYAGINTATASVENPEGRSLELSIEVNNVVSGFSSAAINSSDKSILHTLRYAIPDSIGSTVTFKVMVSEGTQVLAEQTHTETIVPMRRDLADAQSALDEIMKFSAQLMDARGIEDRACFLGVKLQTIGAVIRNTDMNDEDQRVEARETLKHILVETAPLVTLARAALQAQQKGSPMLVGAANPWAPFGGMDELQEDRLLPASVEIAAFGNETESAALNLFNLSSTPRTFYVEPTPLQKDSLTVKACDVIALHEVVEVHTELRMTSADALPKLNSANQITVPAWGARQLWLNVNTDSLAPGEWTGNIRLRSLELVPLDLSCPMKVTVWPARVPDKPTLRHCGWGYVESSWLKDYPLEALADQIEHGTNVFVCTSAPRAQFDASGALVGEIDYKDHDAYLKRYAPHGIVLFCAYQGALQGPAPTNSETYAKAHVLWLRKWVEHLKGLGIAYDNYALYPVDEPGLRPGLAEEFLHYAKLAREADPKMLIYTDPSQEITMDNLREMKPYVDIWCPNRAGLVVNLESKEKLDFILACGKTVWMYECYANSKHQPPLSYYRGQSWLAWKHGMTGIGFWTYCTSPENPWFVSPARSEYTQVYPGNGVVPSKRWEALRDGVEDFALLTSLKESLKTVEHGNNSEMLASAHRLLGEKAGAIGDFCDAKNDEIQIGNDGFPGLRKKEDRQWSEIQAVRSELAQLLSVFAKP